MTVGDQHDLMELMTRKEELHDDLKPWIVQDGPFGPMLKHPLVQELSRATDAPATDSVPLT